MKIKKTISELYSQSKENKTLFQFYSCKNHKITMVEKFQRKPKLI